LIDSGNTSEFGDGAFTGIGSNSVEDQFFFSVAEVISILASFGDLNNQIKIFGVNSSGKDAKNASGGQVLSSKGSKSSDSGGEVLIFFFFKIHSFSGGLVFLRRS